MLNKQKFYIIKPKQDEDFILPRKWSRKTAIKAFAAKVKARKLKGFKSKKGRWLTPSKADVKAWKAQLVAQAEQQVLKLTDSDRFKQYLNTLSKFHRYSARSIDLIYAQNPQATQAAGFKQWQTEECDELV